MRHSTSITRCGLCLILAFSLIGFDLAGQIKPASHSSNPLLTEWTTPFGAPPFDKIKTELYLPALKEGISQKRIEIERIVGNPEPPTFANTIETLDATGELFDKVSNVFYNMISAETSDALQAVAREEAPLESALSDDILMNEKLFARVGTVWEQRNRLGLNSEQLRLVEETYKDFIRGGAGLDADQKKRLRSINEELSLLQLRFGENVLKESNVYKLVIEKQEDLAGLPENSVNAAADAAKAAGLKGKWLFTLQAPSFAPFITYSDNRELRRQILTANLMRGDNNNAQDNKSILIRIALLRSERAKLLGWATHAGFMLEERMAKTPDQVYSLLNRLWTPALKAATRERNDLQAMITQEGSDFKLEAWDWRYYAEKVKKAKFDLDENELRQYFTLEHVLRGAFDVAGKLYGLRFIERKDLPKYNPEVRSFEVLDMDGSHLGVFYIDYHPRPGKRGGAWSSRYRSQHFTQGRDVRPLVVNVCNFTRPSGKTPALLRLTEVETLYHEFGHALHSLLSKIHYKSLGATPRDFVELPSQIMENWAMEPAVLKTVAKHWKTGEAIPDALIEKIVRSAKFNQGFETGEYLAASFLDMDWHTLAGVSVSDANDFEKASLERIGLIPEIPVRYRSSYFSHIFSGGYSAGYYSYIWSELLDSDAFEAFKEKGLFDPVTALSFRKNILEKGATEDAMKMYLQFRGQEPSILPLLEKRGLN